MSRQFFEKEDKRSVPLRTRLMQQYIPAEESETGEPEIRITLEKLPDFLDIDDKPETK